MLVQSNVKLGWGMRRWSPVAPMTSSDISPSSRSMIPLYSTSFSPDLVEEKALLSTLPHTVRNSHLSASHTPLLILLIMGHIKRTLFHMYDFSLLCSGSYWIWSTFRNAGCEPGTLAHTKGWPGVTSMFTGMSFEGVRTPANAGHTHRVTWTTFCLGTGTAFEEVTHSPTITSTTRLRVLVEVF